LFLFAKQTNPTHRSNQVKQEVNCIVILPSLVFPATSVDHFSDITRILRSLVNTSLAFFATKKAAKKLKKPKDLLIKATILVS